LPRKHEMVVNILLLILVLVLIILIIWTYFVLTSVTPGETAIKTALNLT